MIKYTFVLFLILILFSCEKEVKQSNDLVKIQQGNPYSFKNDIQPILTKYCISCHDISSSINLSDYDHFYSFVKSGQIKGSITGDPNYTLMPPVEKLDSTIINKILQWINNGALNN